LLLQFATIYFLLMKINGTLCFPVKKYPAH